MAEQAESTRIIMEKLTKATQRIGEVQTALVRKAALGVDTETPQAVPNSQPLVAPPPATGGNTGGIPKG